MTCHPIIEIEALSHRYGDRLALDDLHLEIRTGEIFGLLGPNGSGKTTVFRILSTLLAPTSGRARLFGIDVDRDPDSIRGRIGVVFQSSSADGKLTVAENLRHQGHLYGLRGGPLRQRIGEILNRFGLADRAADPVETLSGGLARRVEIAKALIHRPDILLLDEPSAGLDPNARRELWEYLEALGGGLESGEHTATVVFTTHLLDEAEACDRLGILDRGALVALDSPPSLKAEIGGDVIFARSQHPERLGRCIRAKFGQEPSIIGDTVRLEREEAHSFIADLIRSFPDLISAVTVRKPTLEDVFTRRTGHRFDESTLES